MPCALAQHSAEQGAGLGLAGLERHAGPAQLAAQPDQPPVVRALVHEQRLAGRDAVHVDPVRLEVVGERLLDVEDHAVEARLLVAQPVEDLVDVGRIGDRAVEVGGQPVHAVLDRRSRPTRTSRVVVPGRVVAAQLDLQAVQAVALDPVGQQHRIAVAAARRRSVRPGPARSRPPTRCQARSWLGGAATRKSAGIPAAKRDRRAVGGLEEGRQVAAQELGRVGLVDRALMQLPEGIVQGEVEGRAADQRRQPGHRLRRRAALLVEPRAAGRAGPRRWKSCPTSKGWPRPSNSAQAPASCTAEIA